MPIVNIRQATKNMSRSKRSALAKNNGRVESAIRGELEGCTYGRIIKALGNKTFVLLDAHKKEHQAHIRGKMARINVDDIVLLSVRDYETRSATDKAVYDIMAVFDKSDASYLVKQGELPKWMLGCNDVEETEDLFDYSADDNAENDEENDGERVKIKRKEVDLNCDDIDIDNI
jgi:translation initiation factor IF-1